MGRSETWKAFRRILTELSRRGVLLESDAALPSVSGLVVGEPVRGSWWGHPRGNEIFRVSRQLAAHPDVIVAKLISGKMTYVHRRFWPALIGVATSGEPWQVGRLSPAARSLLSSVKREGRLRTDQLPKLRSPGQKKWGEVVRELEKRLLVHSEEVHTEGGAHAKWLESWDRWATRKGVKGQEPTSDRAKKQFEDVVDALNEQFGAAGRLPWSRVS